MADDFMIDPGDIFITIEKKIYFFLDKHSFLWYYRDNGERLLERDTPVRS